MTPHACPSGSYREVYHVLDKHFLYTNLASFNMLHRASNLLHRAGCEKTIHAILFFISASGLQLVSLQPPCHKDSKTVLRFEIEA